MDHNLIFTGLAFLIIFIFNIGTTCIHITNTHHYNQASQKLPRPQTKVYIIFLLLFKASFITYTSSLHITIKHHHYHTHRTCHLLIYHDLQPALFHSLETDIFTSLSYFAGQGSFISCTCLIIIINIIVKRYYQKESHTIGFHIMFIFNIDKKNDQRSLTTSMIKISQ